MDKFSLENLKIFFKKYESILSSSTLALGFIFDYLTLQRVDFFWDNFFIILYLLLAGASIILVNLYESGRLRNKFVDSIYEFLPFILQFCFGGLFSAFLIFYSKSASLFTSGAFVLLLFILLVGNEFFKERYSKLVFQAGIYFVALFFFSIYFLPVLVKEMSVRIFLWSGGMSLLLIGIFILIIYLLAPERYRGSDKQLFLTVAGLYLAINFLYFMNIIPPIPLSLKLGDVYHLVEKQKDGSYLVKGEKDIWGEKFDLGQKIHLVKGESAYVFSSVFAPTDLHLKIVHDWQYYDREKGEWVSVNKISYNINGGRNEGYRGFSKKESIFPGEWRVDIKTERGQVVGRVRFDIEIGDFSPELQTKII